MKALFLVNRRSGTGKRDAGEVIRRACAGEPWQVHVCGAKEELDDLIARAIGDGLEAAFAVGGDGTVHEIARRLVGTPLALGVIPAGSGNGFARHLGIPVDPLSALHVLREGRIEAIDSAEADGVPFAGIMGVGFDAKIAERFASAARRGLRTYVRIGVTGYGAFRPEEYELTVDGRTLGRRAVIVAVANTSQYGNNARIAPLASVRDGLLDVVIVKDVSLLRIPAGIARLFAGTFDRTPGVEMLRGREVIIRRESHGPAHLDGEAITLGSEIRVRVLPQSLRVIVPASAANI